MKKQWRLTARLRPQGTGPHSCDSWSLDVGTPGASGRAFEVGRTGVGNYACAGASGLG
jgi:hypothetical protein